MPTFSLLNILRRVSVLTRLIIDAHLRYARPICEHRGVFSEVDLARADRRLEMTDQIPFEAAVDGATQEAPFVRAILERAHRNRLLRLGALTQTRRIRGLGGDRREAGAVHHRRSH